MGSRAGKPNRAVRFKFAVWERLSSGLTRTEREILFVLAVKNWKRMAPVPRQFLSWQFSEDEIQSAADKGLIVEVGDKWESALVGAMRGPDWRRMGGKEWRAARERIFERDDYTCRYCGRRGGKLECDHVQPIAQGGGNEDSNLTTSCFPCNREKRDRTPEQMGWQ